MRFPPKFTFAEQKAQTAEASAICLASLAPSTRTVVQAGGCSGLWPLALSKHFTHVYTCEPSPENFAYLRENIASSPNITAYPYALGDRQSKVGLTRQKPQPGLWTVTSEGDIVLTRLDDLLAHVAVDAIMLDVEGCEAQALRGATNLIAASRPVLWFEYLQHHDDIDAILASYGYSKPCHGIGADCYSLPMERVSAQRPISAVN